MSGNALVPVDPTRPPAIRRSAPRFNLVTENVTFTDREDVRQRLPDILGKALALIWLDKTFADMFARDPPVPQDDVDERLSDDQCPHVLDATASPTGNTVMWWTVMTG